MPNDPQVTIIMSTYNNASTLNRSIQSVLSQTFQNFHFIILNDASTDETSDILDIYSSDKRIQVIKLDKNSGLCANLKLGLEISTSPLIARLDSDDCWHSVDKLRRQVQVLSSDESIGLVGTWARLEGGKDGLLRLPSSDSTIRQQILIRNCFIHSSVVFRRVVALSSGGYSANFSRAEDYDLWLRIGRISNLANIPEDLTTYTVGNGITTFAHHQMLLDSHHLCLLNKSFYPNYYLAQCKWQLQIEISKMKSKVLYLNPF